MAPWPRYTFAQRSSSASWYVLLVLYGKRAVVERNVLQVAVHVQTGGAGQRVVRAVDVLASSIAAPARPKRCAVWFLRRAVTTRW